MAKDHLLRVRIDDIPPEGKELEFELNREHLNARVSPEAGESKKNQVQPPLYVFAAAPHVGMRLDLEGSTVLVRGHVKGKYQTNCARCAEETEQELDIPFDLVLKPHSERHAASGAEEEDLHFGVYDGEVVECTSIAEEFLVLALPFTVLCKDDCKGLCPKCGMNLNQGACNCRPETEGDPRLSALKQIKIVH